MKIRLIKLLLLALPLTVLTHAAPMNVLLICVDDFRPMITSYGDKTVTTPNIDKLAERSISFERAYCQEAICHASRASLYTGYRPMRVRDDLPLKEEYLKKSKGASYDFRGKVDEAFKDTDTGTLFRLFKKHGYHTMTLGKIYHHGYDDADLGIDRKDYYYPETNVGNLPGYEPKDWHMLHLDYLTPENIAIYNKHRMGKPWECADVEDNAYMDGKLAEEAVRRLKTASEENKPFFMAVGFVKPHLPFNAPKKYWDMHPYDTIQLPDTYRRTEGAPHWAYKDFWELGSYFDAMYDGKEWRKDGYKPEDARKLIQGYRACVSYTDAQVGKVLDALQTFGLADNTIVAFYSDHGFKLGEHANFGKHANWEIDTRVPLMVHDPRMPEDKQGRTSRSLVELIDLYPTLCELTEVTTPEHVEGKSLVPVLNNPDAPFKNAAFSQFPRVYGANMMGYTMRTENFRYTEWRWIADYEDHRAGELDVIDGRPSIELYDHRVDPDEMRNLAFDPEYADVVKQLATQMDHGWGWRN